MLVEEADGAHILDIKDARARQPAALCHYAIEHGNWVEAIALLRLGAKIGAQANYGFNTAGVCVPKR